MSEIMERKEALLIGALKYFTGKPCRNGHTAERYTQSGTCERCLRSEPKGEILSPAKVALIRVEPSAIEVQRNELIARKLEIQASEAETKARLVRVRELEIELRLKQSAERSLTKQRKTVIKEKMIEAHLLFAPENYEVITNMVWAAALMHNPLLRKEDVLTGKIREGGVVTVLCFPEDRDNLLKLTNRMHVEQNALNVQARRDRIQAAIEAEAAEDEKYPQFDPNRPM